MLPFLPLNMVTPKAADALTRVAEAVVNSQAISAHEQKEMLEILSALASELAAPKERQRSSLARTLLTRLGDISRVTRDLGALWDTYGRILTAAFG